MAARSRLVWCSRSSWRARSRCSSAYCPGVSSNASCAAVLQRHSRVICADMRVFCCDRWSSLQSCKKALWLNRKLYGS